MKIIRFATYLLALLFPALAYASNLVPVPAVIENNSGLFQYFLGLIILFNLWLMSRWIKDAEANNKQQWESIRSSNKTLHSVKEDVAVLKAEHHIYHNQEK